MDNDYFDLSVVIRFRNERKYLEATLRAIRAQEYPYGRIEIIGVENNSNDGSSEVASRYADRIISVGLYRPGRAINAAIEIARGRYIAVISAHAIPSDKRHFARFREHFDSVGVLGVYGAQLYNIDSRFLDKKDLDIFSSVDPRVETHDSDFWNANSMFSRKSWELLHFDDDVYEFEDHLWTKMLLSNGLRIHYEPRSLVYHYGHMERIDRDMELAPNICAKNRVKMLVKVLQSSEADWKQLMEASLELSSLSRLTSVSCATQCIGFHLLEHPDFDVRWRMAQTLGRIPNTMSAKFLIHALGDLSFYPRDEAAWSLARLGCFGVEELIRKIDSLDSRCLPFAGLSLGASRLNYGEMIGVRILCSLLKQGADEALDAAYFAGELASATGAEKLVPHLNALLYESRVELVRVGCWAMGCFAKIEGAQIDWQGIGDMALNHDDVLVRYEAITAIGKKIREDRNLEMISLLDKCSHDSVGRVRYGAVQSLRLIAEKGVSMVRKFNGKEDSDFGVQFETKLLNKIRCGEKGQQG